MPRPAPPTPWRPSSDRPARSAGATEQPTEQRPVLVVDFGAQYAQLIARRVREASVYSEIVPHTITAEEVRAKNPVGIVLSGGPSSVYEPGAPSLDEGILRLGVPTLGICYGFQVMAQQLGGEVAHTGHREYGSTAVTARTDDDNALLAGQPEAQTVWMSHGDSVAVAPEGFEVLASTATTPVAAFANDEQGFYGVQWHPEVKHSEFGQRVIENFLHRAAGIPADWNSGNVIAEQVARIREQVGSARVIAALSGGVDSAVAAALVHEAVGDQLVCVFVDHGLLRKDEREQVEEDYVAATGIRLVTIDAADTFLDALAGRQRPRAEAQDHRPRVHPRVRAGRARPRRRGRGRRRADPVPRAGHALPRRRRVGRRHGHREHQEPPQRGRPSRRPAVRARRAAAHALQGRGARHRPRARPARGDRRPPAVSGARPRDPHRGRGHR